METLLLTTLIILSYTCLFVLTGRAFIEAALKGAANRLNNFYLKLGASFFIGTTLFLFVWSTLTHLTNDARTSLAIVTVTGIISVVLRLHVLNLSEWTRRRILVVALIMTTMLGAGLLKALIPMPQYYVTDPEVVTPFANFGGVVHSFRAGNLTSFIVTDNDFPIITQHSGQAILASVPMFWQTGNAQLSLVLWLNVFIAALGFVAYGFARRLLSPRLSAIPILTAFLGNTVLSPFYSSITDTESAILLARNIESLFGIGSMFVLFLLFYHFYYEDRTAMFLVLTSVTAFVWSIASGQNIVLSLLALGLGILIARYYRSPLRPLFLTGAVVMIGGVCGTLLQGGMLYTGTTDDPHVPGLMTLAQENEPPISLRFPRTGESGSNTVSKLKELFSTAETPVAEEMAAEGQIAKETIKQNPILFGIFKLARSVQVVFFPLLGLTALWYLLHTGRIEDKCHLLWHLLYVAVITFLAGWVASTFFELYGYHWELSKFLYFGSFSAMLFLGIVLARMLKQYGNRYLFKISIYSLILFITIGPVLDYFVIGLFGNTTMRLSPPIDEARLLPELNARPLELSERFQFLVQDHNLFGTDEVLK